MPELPTTDHPDPQVRRLQLALVGFVQAMRYTDPDLTTMQDSEQLLAILRAGVGLYVDALVIAGAGSWADVLEQTLADIRG